MRLRLIVDLDTTVTEDYYAEVVEPALVAILRPGTELVAMKVEAAPVDDAATGPVTRPGDNPENPRWHRGSRA